MNTQTKHMENTTQHRNPSQPPEEPNKTQQQSGNDVFHVETASSGMKIGENESLKGLCEAFQVEKPNKDASGSSACRRSSPTPGVEAGDEVKEEETIRVVESKENVREKLKKHRIEVAGRVWIPEIWGQEELLKDWIDCSAFDDSLVPRGIMSARAALVEEGRRANSGGFRIENRIEDAICEVSHGADSGEKLSPTLQKG